MESKVEIIIKGLSATGKTTIAVLLEEFLKEKGFDVEMDLSLELLDYGSEEKFREHIKLNLDKREQAVKEKSYINISQIQTVKDFF